MWEIEVGLKEHLFDAIGEGVKNDIKEDLLIKGIESVKYVEGYRIEAELSQEEAEKAADKLFADPITHDFAVNKPLHQDFDWEIKVLYQPQMTDNVGIAAREGIKDLLGRDWQEGEGVRTVRKYVIKGRLNEGQVKRICTRLLANELIESFEYRKGKKK